MPPCQYSAGASPGLYNWDELDLNPRKVAVASTDPDDALAGTGAKWVTIEGTDENQERLSETIMLDGQTPVESVGLFSSIYRMENTSDQDMQGQCYTGASDAVWVGGEPDVVRQARTRQIYCHFMDQFATCIGDPEGYEGRLIAVIKK